MDQPKNIMIIRGSSAADIKKIERCHAFLKWFKQHHPFFFDRYASSVILPDDNLIITMNMNLIAPEDRLQMQLIINSFNTLLL